MPTLQRLFDPVNQFELRNGQLNVAGKLYVYLNGTDDLANVYGNNMEQLAQPIILDADGRAPGLFVDSSHMYWIKVCGRGGNEQYSVKDMVPIGSGSGGSGSDVEVISTDGTVKVDSSVDGGVKTFDLSVAEDSTECLEWFDGGVQELSSGDVYPLLEAGTMEVEAERGLRVYQDRLYHVTSSFTVTPTGAGVTYNTLEVSLMYVGSGSPVPVMTREYDIDNSLTDHVDIGFGCDVMAPGDGVLYWHVGGAENFARVDGRMQVHRVYSGVAAVPGTVATKTWVEGNFQTQSGMSAYVGYSAVSGSSGMVTAIGGSAISAGTDSATVSAIASAYAGSAASGKMDSSASSGFYPASNPSGFAQESGLSAYIPFSAIGGSGSSISGINGSAIGGGGKTYSGVWPVVVDNSADTVSVDHIPLCTDSTITAYMSGGSAVLGVVPSSIDMSGYAKESALSAKLDASASSDFMLASGMTAYQPSGDYAFNSALSGKMDASASSDFMLASGMTAYQPSGDYAFNSALSGKMDASGMTAYQEKSGMTAYQPSGDYAYNSALSSKFDASASGAFYPSGNPSGFIGSADTSALGYSSMGTITVIGRNLESTDSARLGMEEITTGHQWMSVYGVTIDFNQLYFTVGNSASIYMQSLEPTANIRAVEFRDQNYNTILTTGVEASSVSMPMPSGTRYMTVTGDNYGSVEFNYTAKNVVPGTVVPLAHRSALSAKMDATASGKFMLASGMSAYQLSGDYAYNSALSAKFDASASGAFYPSGNPSGFISSSYTPTFNYNSANQITSIDGSALGGMDEGAVSAIASAYAESAASSKMDASGMSAYQLSGDYAYNSAVSGKMDASASSDFMFASGMSAYQLSGDYAYNSALSSKFDASASGAFYPSGNPSGFLTAQAQASWTESASASPSYIQDKPDLADIVAGPGIHIDNPDGNTLRVSVAQELATELWSGDSGQITGATDGSLPLSEAAEHFEYLLVYVSGSAMSGGIVVLRFHPNGDNTSFYPLTVSYTNDGGTIFTDSCVVKIAGSTFYIKFGMRTGINASGTVIAATNRGPIIKKIVGINRISS